MARSVALAVVVVVVVLVAGTTAFHGPPTLYQPPTHYNTAPVILPFPGNREPILLSRVAVDQTLPCPTAGFFTHPKNCSQFYRCVDYTETGQVFSRYGYECPKDLIFAANVVACVPGVCAGTLQPVGTPPPPPIAPPHLPPPHLPPLPALPPPVTPFPVIHHHTIPDRDKTRDPPIPSTDPSISSTDPTVQSTDSPVDTATDDTAQSPPPSESCQGQYEQHDQYCNVYRKCNETETRYICPAGTVFDAPRQMCRISAADERLCAGKVIGKPMQSLRADTMVDGHIRIPDDYVLTPIVPFMPLTNPGVPSPYLGVANPVSSNHRIPAQPQIHPHAPSFYAPSPALPAPYYGLPAPYHALPADTLPLPADTLPLPAYSQPQALSLVRPGPLTSPYRASAFDSLPYSVNNVRRPEDHLHLPYYSPYAYGIPDVGPDPYYAGMYYR